MADARKYIEQLTINGPITAASRKYIGELIQAAEHHGRELVAQGQDPSMFTARGSVDAHAQQAAVQADMAREARIGARDIAAAYYAKQAQDGPHSAMLGQASGVGPALNQPSRGEPGKMFSRETIVAILRAERTRPQSQDSLETLNRLQSIFENLE